LTGHPRLAGSGTAAEILKTSLLLYVISFQSGQGIKGKIPLRGNSELSA
jgi:hypothetical protein